MYAKRIDFSQVPKIFATMMIGFALSSCQTTSANGTGDVALSQNVARAFLQEYMKKPKPLAFAVSTGGQYYYYYYCDGPKCSNPANVFHKTIETCESKSHLPCKMFAYGKNIVWTKSNGSPYTIEDVYAVVGMTPEDRMKESYTKLSNLKLCEGALSKNAATWTDTYTQRHYVAEATSRGMQPAFCAKLLGRDG